MHVLGARRRLDAASSCSRLRHVAYSKDTGEVAKVAAALKIHYEIQLADEKRRLSEWVEARAHQYEAHDRLCQISPNPVSAAVLQ